MTTLDKYLFKKITNDPELLSEIDETIYGPDQVSLKNAHKFIQHNYETWIKSPTIEQFIELIKYHGQQEYWTGDEIESIFSNDTGVDQSFLENNIEKRLIIWRTQNAIRKAAVEFRTIEMGDYRNMSLEQLKKKTQQLTDKLSKDVDKTAPKKKKLTTFNVLEFPSMDWPIYEPLKCGYPMWDKYHLIKRGCITTILGATGSRKSTFLLNLTGRLAQNGYKVLYVIIEGNIRMNIETLVSQIQNISRGEVQDDHYQNDILKNVDIAHQNYGLITVDDIDVQLEGNQYDAVILDYVTLLTEEDQTLFLKGQIISQKLKNVAEKHNLGVITANQTNKPANNKIQLDVDDVGESHGITMAMDVMLGIIKYQKLENQQRTALQIMKIRDLPNEIELISSGPIEGTKEMYSIEYINKKLSPIDDTYGLNQIRKDIKKSDNNKLFLGDDEIKSTPINKKEDGMINVNELFDANKKADTNQ